MTASSSGFEVIDHPADMGLRCWARNPAELYAVAASALTCVLVDVDSTGNTAPLFIHLEAQDREALMYIWLSEILYYFDGEKKICSNFAVDLEETAAKITLRAKMQAGDFNNEEHVVKTYVKAITFHQMQIEESAEGCRAQIYLDI